MEDSAFSDWMTALKNLQKSVSKDLEEIRQQKAEIIQIKMDVFNRVAPGQYIRDDQRIVISAPEIILGNVDASGMQWGDTSSSIVIRGNQISMEGVGDSGTIKSRAPFIEQIAVDPGPDGVEEVVQPQSQIINMAKNIVIQSNDSEDYFSQAPRQTAGTGIRIHADENLEIDVSQSVEARGEEISNRLSELNDLKKTLTSEASDRMDDVSSLISKTEDVLEAQEELNYADEDVSTNVVDLDDLQDQFEALITALYQAVDGCIKSLSSLAETNRCITALTNEQSKLSKKSPTFQNETTNARLSINAETMEMASVDGDGNIRTNPEALLNIQTGTVSITTLKADGSLIDDSSVNIATHDVNISTINRPSSGSGSSESSKESASSDDKYTTEGSLNIQTKNLSVIAEDNNGSGGESGSGKTLTKDSSIYLHVENMMMDATDSEGNVTGSFGVTVDTMVMGSYDKDGNTTGSLNIQAKAVDISSTDKDGAATGTVSVKAEDIAVASTDKEGKALGQISVNGKNIFIKSMDSDDKGNDKSLAAGGNMVVVAENMFVGRTDKDNTSKTLQISSDKTGIYGTTTAELQQGEAKAVVQLDGGNIAISGSKAEYYGDNTVNGKTDFKADATMTKLTADNVEAKSSFKSTNISDGVAVPGAPSSAKLSAKLTEADAPKPKVVEAEAEAGGES